MAPRFRNRIALLTLAAALSAGTVTPILYADDAGFSVTDTVDTPSIGSVSIGSNSSIELKQASVLAGDDGKVVTFTITLHNDEEQEIQFIDYWTRLLGDGGSKFTVNVTADDKNKNKVAPHSSMDISFYAKVNSSTNLSDLTFRFIKWDFSASDYERVVGDIQIPADYSTVTPLSRSTAFTVTGTTMKSSISRLLVNKNDDYYLTTAYVNMENIGLKSATLDSKKYSYAIQTPEGYVYALTEAPDSKDITLAPRVKKELRLNTSIPSAVSPEGWTLLIMQQGTDAKLPVAVFELPSATTGDNGGTASESYSIDLNGTPVSSKVNRVSINKTDTNYSANVYFNFKNDGVKAATLLGYQFTLINQDGLSYPLTSSTDLTKVSLTPRSNKEVQLTVSIPTSVNIDNMKLQMIQPSQNGNDDRFNYPLATFDVPKATTNDISLGVVYPFTDKNGTYAAKLISIQRMPLDAQDILSADLELGNQGDALLPLPTLQGYFLLDGSVKINANLQQSDSVNSIASKSSIHYSLLGQIPYTTSFKDIKLVLQGKDDSAASPSFVTVAEFKNNSELLQVPVIAKDDTYNLNSVGKQAGIRVANVQSYTGTFDNLYYMELEVQNLEKRFSKLSGLKAFIKTQDDLYYPATITSVANPVSPKAKATVSLWSKLPKEYTIDNLDIVVGEAVKLSSDANAGDGYVRAVDMKLPGEDKRVKNIFDDMIVGGYSVSFSSVKTDAKDKNFTLDYKISKQTANMPELPNGVNHKIVFELTDSQSNKFTFTTQDLDTLFSSSAGGAGTFSKPLTVSDWTAFANKATSASYYTLNVYDDFGTGYRKLIGTNTFRWFN